LAPVGIGLANAYRNKSFGAAFFKRRPLPC
jgi:hypothetical protein